MKVLFDLKAFFIRERTTPILIGVQNFEEYIPFSHKEQMLDFPNVIFYSRKVQSVTKKKNDKVKKKEFEISV